MAELKVGDMVVSWHGPYRAHARVAEITENGAVLDLPEVAVLVGWDRPEFAPNGTQLTRHGRQAWIGRAHWHSVEVIPQDGSWLDRLAQAGVAPEDADQLRFELERDAERGGP